MKKPTHKNKASKKLLVTAQATPVAAVKKSIFPYIIIAALGFILYGNTISHDYALDDAIVIVQNQFTTRGVSGIGDIFSYDTFTGFWMTSYPGKTADEIQEEKKLVAGGRYRPLSLAGFAVEMHLFGEKETDNKGVARYTGNPHISHFINIVLYVITCLLLYRILLRLVPQANSKPWYLSFAFIAALLFLAHPIHTEAVANIKGRDEILTLLGSLGALWFTLRYLDKKKPLMLLWSSLSLFLGLLSKENAITFLAMIPLSVYFFTNHSLKKNVISWIPLLFAAIVFLLIRYSILGGASGEKQIVQELMNNPFVGSSIGEKYATIFFTLWKYIQLLVFPHPLTYDYYPKQIPIIGWSDYRAFLPLLLYMAMGLYALYGTIKRKDVVSYGIWFIIIPLSVVSNLFFPVGTFMNERFVFISSIGFCLIAAWLLADLLPKLAHKLKFKPGGISITLLTAILVLYSTKTISRNRAWENDFVLFTTDVQVSYNSAKSTCSAGGKLIEEAQKPKIKNDTALHNSYCRQAIAHLERSLEIYPEYVDAINLLGNAWYELEMNSVKALNAYTRVLSLRPYHGIALGNTKVIINNAFGLLISGNSVNNPDELIEALDELDAVKPGIGELYHLKGTIYGRYQNQLDSALVYLNKAAVANSSNPNLYLDLGVAHGMKGDLQSALSSFLKAIELNQNDPQSWINAGLTYQHLGDMQKASECFNRAEQLKKNQKQ